MAVLGARIWEERKGLCADVFENLAVIDLDLEPSSHVDYVHTGYHFSRFAQRQCESPRDEAS